MRLLYLGIGAVASVAAAMALFGTATATANDYVGKTYADASEAMDEQGLDPIVATRVGDKLGDRRMHRGRRVGATVPARGRR